jgi:dCTP diphosphatase
MTTNNHTTDEQYLPDLALIDDSILPTQCLMSSTNDTSIADIQEALCNFRDERDWKKFHSPKNLSESIAIEAAELMEHFQWLTTEEAVTLAQKNSPSRTAIEEELADVLIYCFCLADILDCDITKIMFDKITKNGKKYPIDHYQGRVQLEFDFYHNLDG